MWDLHNHLLWGLDDGARSEAESVAMWATLRDAGYRGVVVTPHRRPGRWDLPVAELEARAASVRAAIAAAGHDPAACELRVGAEHFFDDTFLERVEGRGLSTLGAHTRWYLVELPVMQAPVGLRDVLFRAQLRRYRTVIAHPERYGWLFERRAAVTAETLVDAGCVLQVDLPALLGLRGAEELQRAESLLSDGFVHLAAGDAHSLEDARAIYPRAAAHVRRLCGADGERLLLDENPRRIVSGAPPEEVVAWA